MPNQKTKELTTLQSKAMKVGGIRKVVPSTLIGFGTRRKAKTSETRQSLSRTLSIPKQTFNPPGNVRSGCRMWTSSSQNLIKTQRVNPKSLNTLPVKQPVRMTSTASAQACYP